MILWKLSASSKKSSKLRLLKKSPNVNGPSNHYNTSSFFLWNWIKTPISSIKSISSCRIWKVSAEMMLLMVLLKSSRVSWILLNYLSDKKLLRSSCNILRKNKWFNSGSMRHWNCLKSILNLKTTHIWAQSQSKSKKLALSQMDQMIRRNLSISWKFIQ